MAEGTVRNIDARDVIKGLRSSKGTRYTKRRIKEASAKLTREVIDDALSTLTGAELRKLQGARTRWEYYDMLYDLVNKKGIVVITTTPEERLVASKHFRTLVEDEAKEPPETPSDADVDMSASDAKPAPKTRKGRGSRNPAFKAEHAPPQKLAELFAESRKLSASLFLDTVVAKTGLSIEEPTWFDTWVTGAANKALMRGYKYCGGGTDIVGNLRNAVPPLNELDRACRLHDIEYTWLAGHAGAGLDISAQKQTADKRLHDKITELIGEHSGDPADRGVRGIPIADLSFAESVVRLGFMAMPWDAVGKATKRVSLQEQQEAQARATTTEARLDEVEAQIKRQSTTENFAEVVRELAAKDGDPDLSPQELIDIADLTNIPHAEVQRLWGAPAEKLAGHNIEADPTKEAMPKQDAKAKLKAEIDRFLRSTTGDKDQAEKIKQHFSLKASRKDIASIQSNARSYGDSLDKLANLIIAEHPLPKAALESKDEPQDPVAEAQAMEGKEPVTVQDEAGADIGFTPIDLRSFQKDVIEPVQRAASARINAEYEAEALRQNVAKFRGGEAPAGSSAIGAPTIQSAQLPNVAMPQIAPPIIGERNMRSTLIRESADAVKLTAHQKEMNRRWYENFKWVDEGFGNGNLERLPWDEKSGEYSNSLYRAQKVNEHIRYSGELFDGGQRLTRIPQQSAESRYRHQVPMIPDVQNHQAWQRAGPLPARAGRPIQMMRDNPNDHLTRKEQLFARDMRGYHPQVVADSRGVTRV